MASCENPPDGRDEDQTVQVDDSDSDGSHHEIVTPSSRKDKEVDGGSASKSGRKIRKENKILGLGSLHEAAKGQ